MATSTLTHWLRRAIRGLAGLPLGKSQPPRHLSTPSSRPTVECLEDRRLMATFVPNGVVTMYGSYQYANLVTLSDGLAGVLKVDGTIKGQLTHLEYTNVKKVVFLGGNGDDVFTNNSQWVQVEAHGGGGNDVLRGGTLNATLYGDDGNDQL